MALLWLKGFKNPFLLSEKIMRRNRVVTIWVYSFYNAYVTKQHLETNLWGTLSNHLHLTDNLLVHLCHPIKNLLLVKITLWPEVLSIKVTFNPFRIASCVSVNPYWSSSRLARMEIWGGILVNLEWLQSSPMGTWWWLNPCILWDNREKLWWL